MDSQEKIPHGWIKVKSKTRPDKHYYYHKEKKISVWKLSDCNDESKINFGKKPQNKTNKTPNKSPKKESKLSNHSLKIGKRNLANERMKALQCKLKEEAKRLKNENVLKDKPKINKQEPFKKETVVIKIVEKCHPVPATPESSRISQELSQSSREQNPTKVPNSIEIKPNENSKSNELSNISDTLPKLEEDESFKMDVDEQQLDKSTESLGDFEEAMDWEDIDEKLVVQEVHNIRTKNNPAESSCFSSQREGDKFSKSDFYIIVDTNVLLSNLSLVKEIKSKLFKDIGRAYIYLPYIVLCELDRLKLREENIARLARTAISFIDDCFKAKDEFLLGQNALQSSRELIEIDSGDDYIINSALQMKEFTTKIIVLSNDKNLRNKAFVNGFEAFSADTLSYVDYNVSNKIKFD